ncbi:MAG TPA: ABC transporter permease [Bryobacteraceae bacterium]|nr:ABC transporter permease [Bryobacteraceae bacterium]
MFDALSQDLRYAVRLFRNSPGFTAVALLSLALGIGANTSIFSLIDALLLRSLPVFHPEELLQVHMAPAQFFSNPMWEQIRDRQDVFSALFAYGRWPLNLSADGEARYADGQFVSGGYFDTLHVHAVLGRTLVPADDQRGCPGAAVLSYAFWQRAYGGRDVLGRTITLDAHPIPIVGVADPRFTGIDVGTSVDVLVPLCAEEIIHGETSHLETNAVPGDNNNLFLWLRIIGRPQAGISPSRAAARLKTLAPAVFRATLPRHWRPQDQARYLQRTLAIRPIPTGLSYLRPQYRQPLFILMVIVGMVLLIACANVANLLLARGAARRREIAIRMALGSGRGRLFRQLLTESLLLACSGAALGVIFAQWATRRLAAYLDVPLDLAPDLRVLSFTAAVAILAGLFFGMAPAWRGARVPPQAAMKANSRGVLDGSRFGLGKALVAAQIALSVLLVAGAGLLLATFWQLAQLNPGFDPGRVLLTDVDLRNGHYPAEERAGAFREMLARIRAIPGVRAASISDQTPLCGCNSTEALAFEGRAPSAADLTVSRNLVSAGYFQTLGTPLLAGRDFDSGDTPTSPPVAIVNQTLARRYFGSASPLGHRFRILKGDRLSDPVEIVGVVGDAKYGSLREEIAPTVYSAWSQDATANPQAAIAIRAAAGDPAALIPPVKSAIAQLNRGVSIEFTSLAAKVGQSLARERLLALLSGFFGGLALLLAAIGLYGLMSYTIARRRNEIGIRMALGAGPARLLAMVLREVAVLIAAGLTLGLLLCMAMTRLITSLLYGVQPNDPPMLALAAAALGATAALAGYLPARRASRMDPMAALREE